MKNLSAVSAEDDEAKAAGHLKHPENSQSSQMTKIFHEAAQHLSPEPACCDPTENTSHACFSVSRTATNSKENESRKPSGWLQR